MAKQYDLTDDSVVVVIGSGAGGGTLSNELAQKGVDVVCLEAGRRLSLSDVVNDPPLMDQRMGWHDERRGAPVWLCKTVGGTTMRWSGVCPRFLAHEFRARTTYGAMDDTSLIDWPLTLEELEPYYDQAEAKMGVSGTNGLPPSAENNNFRVLAAGARRIGYRDITTAHIAINSVAYDGRPGCLQIGFCNEGCAIGAKWSTLYTEIPKAEATDHFELRTGVMAVKINHDESGKVTGVVYADADGALHELELTRFRGHIQTAGTEVSRHVEEEGSYTVRAGVPAADGRAGPGGAHAGRAGARVRAHSEHDPEMGRAAGPGREIARGWANERGAD